MFDSKRLLDQVLGSGFVSGMAGGAAGAATLNALSGKKVKKYAGTALKAGGLALIGGLAYKAWQHYRKDEKSATAPPAAFLPEVEEESTQLNMLLTRAMISAARADGSIDNDEHNAVMSRISEMQLDPTEKAYLFEQFTTPVDLHALAADVDNEAQAAEVYAASLVVLSSPSPEEQRYLDQLASQLKLSDGLVQEIQRTVSLQQASA